MCKQCVVTGDAENVLHVFEDKYSPFSQCFCANFLRVCWPVYIHTHIHIYMCVCTTIRLSCTDITYSIHSSYINHDINMQLLMENHYSFLEENIQFCLWLPRGTRRFVDSLRLIFSSASFLFSFENGTNSSS